MTPWVVVVIVVLALIVLAWIANAYRLAAKYRNVARRSATALGTAGPPWTRRTRSVAEGDRTEDRPPGR